MSSVSGKVEKTKKIRGEETLIDQEPKENRAEEVMAWLNIMGLPVNTLIWMVALPTQRLISDYPFS